MDDGYKTCAFCGKRFDVFRHVTHPTLWGYRWGQTFFCSWKCLRAQEKVKTKKGNGGPATMAKKLTLEQKKKAVQIAIEGGKPQDFLKECGCTMPDQTWFYIKQKVKETNPELYAKIPSRVGSKKITIKASESVSAAVGKVVEATTITQEVNKPMETLVPKPNVKIEIKEAISGKFTFVNISDGGIIIENNVRNQQLTLEKKDIDDLLEVIPIIREMFKKQKDGQQDG